MIKILFVCSGNLSFGISPFIKSQGDSLVKKGVEVEYFTIKGKGILGYLRNIRLLRKILKKNNYDIVHSHYSFSSYVVSLAGAKNQVVSLMGSDVNSSFFEKILIKFFNTIFWKVCIVKSEDMKGKVGIKDALIIPNGVDLDKFKYIDRAESCRKVGFNPTEKHLIFAASPERIEKNFELAKKAFELLQIDNVNLKIVSDVKHDMIPYYFNAADVLVLTSIYEGSPNVIKEAMACNCPIVSTDVGDVRWVFGDTEGCYISSNSPADFAKFIQKTIKYRELYGEINGRERIFILGLDSGTIAERIIKIYNEILEPKSSPSNSQQKKLSLESLKILFVCSGNSEFGISPVVKNQGESLKKNGMELDYFAIKGKGFKGYFKNILPLRKYLKDNEFDIIHAHYALCGWVAVLANKFKKPIIVSYMGSDTYGDYDANGKLIFSSYIQIFLAKILQLFVNTIIVKSKNLERYIYMKKKGNIIPNGVDYRIFEIIEKNEARNYLKLDLNKKYILFLGDKENKRKNYQLLQKANIISKNNFEIINPYPTEHGIIPYYLNACDLLVSTSFNEGSPNTIKEAMTCNCPIVSTDVGDIPWVFGDTEGCHIASFDPEDVADKIQKALDFGTRTNGREKIIQLGLDSNIIAKRIIKIYNEAI